MQDFQETAERERGPRARIRPPLNEGDRIGSPLSHYAFAWGVNDRYKEVLRTGALVVLFAGPRHAVELPPRAYALRDPDLANADFWSDRHWPKTLTNFGATPIDDADDYNDMPGHTTVLFRPGQHRYGTYLAPFAERFERSLRWHAAWNLFDVGGKRKEDFYLLFSNRSGQWVGYIREHFIDKRRYRDQQPGLTVVLPNVEDANRRREAILFLVTEILPYLRPEDFPGHWYHVYLPLGLSTRRDALKARRNQIEEELHAEEESIATEAARFEEYKPLLRLTGDPLKDLGQKALREVFGFRVIDLDQYVKPGDATGADLL